MIESEQRRALRLGGVTPPKLGAHTRVVPHFVFDLGKTLLKAILLSPLFAAYGVYVLVRGLAGLLRGVNRGRLALRDKLRCPHGHANPVTGRWRCASCSATYHGWIGRCGVCGAGALWFPCNVCGVGVRLPWERGT